MEFVCKENARLKRALAANGNHDLLAENSVLRARLSVQDRAVSAMLRQAALTSSVAYKRVRWAHTTHYEPKVGDVTYEISRLQERIREHEALQHAMERTTTTVLNSVENRIVLLASSITTQSNENEALRQLVDSKGFDTSRKRVRLNNNEMDLEAFSAKQEVTASRLRTKLALSDKENKRLSSDLEEARVLIRCFKGIQEDQLLSARRDAFNEGLRHGKHLMRQEYEEGLVTRRDNPTHGF